MALLGETEAILALVGRYNQITLWNWQQDRMATLDYRTGGQNDYITRLASAEQRPHLLAIADNQGHIALWNTEDCFENNCEALDTFTASEEGLRSLALSPDGCYLAAGGDDGRLRLWTLTNEGLRSRSQSDGTEIAHLGTPIYSVDLFVKDGRLAIAVGTLTGQIRLYRQDLNPLACG
jgi:WD40 repeat protein